MSKKLHKSYKARKSAYPENEILECQKPPLFIDKPSTPHLNIGKSRTISPENEILAYQKSFKKQDHDTLEISLISEDLTPSAQQVLMFFTDTPSTSPLNIGKIGTPLSKKGPENFIFSSQRVKKAMAKFRQENAAEKTSAKDLTLISTTSTETPTLDSSTPINIGKRKLKIPKLDNNYTISEIIPSIPTSAAIIAEAPLENSEQEIGCAGDSDEDYGCIIC